MEIEHRSKWPVVLCHKGYEVLALLSRAISLFNQSKRVSRKNIRFSNLFQIRESVGVWLSSSEHQNKSVNKNEILSKSSQFESLAPSFF